MLKVDFVIGRHAVLAPFCLEAHEVPRVVRTDGVRVRRRALVRWLGCAEAGTEAGNHADDEGLEGWGAGTHDGEVNFDGGPVGCRAAVPCLVCGVF